jgi:tetratricopeptide (TPR) repeat protein
LAKTDLRAAGDPPAPDLPQKTHAPSNRAAAKRLFDQGAQAFKKNAYHRAIERFNRFAALMPDEAKGHYNLAICYHRLNRGAKALTHAKRAAELGADAALKILPRIQAKMCPRPRPHTPRSADRPLTGDGDDPAGVGAAQIDGTIDARGSAAVWDADELGEEITQCAPVGAPEKYRQRARQDPIVPERAAGTGTGKGAAAPGNGPGDAVSEHFLRDERLKTIFDLGRSAVEDNEYFQAIQHFTTATHLAPQDPRGFYHLAEVSFRLRFYETAREHAKRAIELGSSGAKEIMSRIDALRVPA